MNHVRRLALCHGHVQRREDELGAEMRFHRPANHAATPRVDHDGQIQEPEDCPQELPRWPSTGCSITIRPQQH